MRFNQYTCRCSTLPMTVYRMKMWTVLKWSPCEQYSWTKLIPEKNSILASLLSQKRFSSRSWEWHQPVSRYLVYGKSAHLRNLNVSSEKSCSTIVLAWVIPKGRWFFAEQKLYCMAAKTGRPLANITDKQSYWSRYPASQKLLCAQSQITSIDSASGVASSKI